MIEITSERILRTIEPEGDFVDNYWDYDEFLEEYLKYSASDLCYTKVKNLRGLVKEFHIHTWVCTDTLVGFKSYLYENELMYSTKQIGRKYCKEYTVHNHELLDMFIEKLNCCVQEDDVEDSECIDLPLEFECDLFVYDYLSQVAGNKNILIDKENTMRKLVKVKKDYSSLGEVIVTILKDGELMDIKVDTFKDGCEKAFSANLMSKEVYESYFDKPLEFIDTIEDY